MTTLRQIPPVPGARRRVLNAAPVRRRGEGARHVLYWMTATRRTRSNFGLQRALCLAEELGLPLVVLEGLDTGYPDASARVAGEVAAGMADNHAGFVAARARLGAGAPRYLAYLEPRPGAGRGLALALAADAAAVVGDSYPTHFQPALQRALSGRLQVAHELVDSAALVPMSKATKAFARALDMRRFLHRRLPEELGRWPHPEPLADHRPRPDVGTGHVDEAIAAWPMLFDSARPGSLGEADLARAVAVLEVDHGIAVPEHARGTMGPAAARARLAAFLDHDLDRYADQRRRLGGTSLLSPALHYGHLGPHEVLARLFELEPWHPEDAEPAAAGRRTGWWGLSEDAEAWLDQLVTWRELGWNQAMFAPRHRDYAGLPDWARTTLDEHRADPRPWTYDRATFEAAATHDEVWNAAQRQLVREGRIEGYLRMLWGKLILEWSATPEEAHETCLVLNDRYARDGRDPNSYSAINWVFGKFDRAWGPERPVYGKVRCMTSANTRRKLRLDAYLERYGDRPVQPDLLSA